ncbi:hypothetical protein [Streptomyces genisteinicus]|uniref:DUF2637 domain-containing protein n=1 Tax=Streptomyces genisteinicus TaxID=2768068 RepID=A0A7H0I5A1_9ACTN|nr:hypothetical protein [Streptomyces genisteinicus]QNP67967.1 hypothetical protein IAG43_33930 [Streptomyces genisteinicus]
MDKITNTLGRVSPRDAVLAVLGFVTLGVAVLSVAVSYNILKPAFGGWAVPTVVALDALWVVFQATEVLAGNNARRAVRVRVAGLVLTAVNAAIPTAELLLRDGRSGVDLAVVLTPLAIVATKTAWWIALPALGRRSSAGTRAEIDQKARRVADRLEVMEADAAARIELLDVARELEERVGKAETAYRLAVLQREQAMTKALVEQAQATEKTLAETPLPASVTRIALPVLDDWTPDRPALLAGRDAVTPTDTDGSGRHTTGTQASAPDRDRPSHPTAHADTLQQIATVTGVPVPVPGEQLTGPQLGVVLRHLRYAEDPPASYRQAVKAFRQAGYVGSEERVRHEWGALMSREEQTSEASDDDAEEEADA